MSYGYSRQQMPQRHYRGGPQHNGFPAPPQHGYQRQAPQRREPFVLDRFGANPNTPFEVPQYRVVNEVPLPFKRDEKGLIKELLRCFNCGSADHKLTDCKEKFNRGCVNMNKSWMNDFARIGAKRRKPQFNKERYFVQPTTKAVNLSGKSATDNGTSTSSQKEDSDRKEPTPPPLLQVWNSSKDVKDKPSAPELPARGSHPPSDRRQRGSGRHHRDHRDHRDHRGGDHRDHRDRRSSRNGHRNGPPAHHRQSHRGPQRGYDSRGDYRRGGQPHHGHRNSGPPPMDRWNAANNGGQQMHGRAPQGSIYDRSGHPSRAYGRNDRYEEHNHRRRRMNNQPNHHQNHHHQHHQNAPRNPHHQNQRRGGHPPQQHQPRY